MGEGFFKIDRQLFDSWIWKQNGEPFDILHAWIYLIGMANYKTSKRYYRGQFQSCERGQLVTSISKLAKDWGWSENKVRRFLRTLERDSMVRVNSTTSGTTITIENYAKFQDSRRTSERTNGRADGRVNERTDERTDGTHKKNIKEREEPQEARARAGEPSADLWEDDEEDFGSYQSSDTSNLTDAEKKALLLAWEREAFKMREGNN